MHSTVTIFEHLQTCELFSFFFFPRYIPAENIPVSYGGLKREGDVEFSGGDDVAITELAVKAGSTENVEIPLPQVHKLITRLLLVPY